MTNYFAEALPADQIYGFIHKQDYEHPFAAADLTTNTVYIVFWTDDGDLVGETASYLDDAGRQQRDVITLDVSSRPLAVWFPAGEPDGWKQFVDDALDREARYY